MRTVRSFLLLLVAASLLVPAGAAAQWAHPTDTAELLRSPTLSPHARRMIQERIDAVHTRFRETHGGLGPEQFGTQCCQITQIPAAAFNPTSTSGTQWSIDGLGYASPSVVTLQVVLAPVFLSSGVEIQFIDLYYQDTNPTNDVTAALYAFSGGAPGSGAPTSTTIATVASQGSGYSYDFSLPFSYTVNNNVAYDPAAAQLSVAVAVSGGNLGFKAVDLWWMRQVSPAPAVASFSDVPTSHPFFQFIEALYAAGITVGCGTNPLRFCPDDPITRGQEAVFISKALGLYWPN